MINNEKKITDDNKLPILFQQINSWLQHLDHILWAVTSLIGTLNVLIIWKRIAEAETTNTSIVRWSYLILIGLHLFFSMSIETVSMKLAELLEDKNLTSEKFRKAIEFRLRDLFSLRPYRYLLFKPWGIVTLTYTGLSLFSWWKLFLN